MSSPTPPKYVVIAGGLTGGPIAPLLGVVNFWRSKNERITPVIVDVANSFGETIAHTQQIKFCKIITGKLRRYKTWKNLLFPLWLLIGFLQSLFILQKVKPRIVLGAGGFAQIPVMYAAWILRIPRVIHQQDVLVTLSNKLCSPIANLITTTFESSIRDFYQETGLGKTHIKGTKVFWTGNPSEYEEFEKMHKKHPQLSDEIKLHDKLPVLLVFGGASGAQGINTAIINALSKLTKVVQIIHIVGPNNEIPKSVENYHPIKSSKNMPALYNAADLVICRAGINTLTELAEFKKPSIIVPMPNSHQELNAQLLYDTQSALIVDQNELTPDVLIKAIRKVMFEADLQKNYVTNMRKLFPKNASANIIALIEKLLDAKHPKQKK